MLLVALPVTAVAVIRAPQTDAGMACGSQYSYAGLSHGHVGRAVRATITPLARPQVDWGHVAAWIGVGGPGLGPNGTDAWIQVGFSGFYGGVSKLYYEVARPGHAPRYFEIDADVAIGRPRRLAVGEIRGRRNWWQVWVDGARVGEPVHLPGSHRRWAPIATTESWNAGKGGCNRFAYRFERVAIDTRLALWKNIAPGTVFRSPGYALNRRPAGFVASGG